MMDPFCMKFSGGKIVPRSDLRVGTVQAGQFSNSTKTKTSRNFKLATWNLRGKLELGRLEGLGIEAKKYKVDIVAVQETNKKGEGQMRVGDYTFFYGGADVNRLGTGFLVHKQFLSAIKNFKFVNNRLSFLEARGPKYNYIFVNVHCPTLETDSETKDLYYAELDRLLDNFNNFDAKIILGDFNAQIGRRNNLNAISYRQDDYHRIAGRESLHEVCNDNGKRVVELAASRGMRIKSTSFKHKSIHKITWDHPNRNFKAQIDHILIDERRHTNVLDVRTYRGAVIGSDHYLVVAKMRFRLSQKNENRPRNKIEKFDLDKLKDPEVRYEYTAEIQNKFEVLARLRENEDNESSLDEAWNNVKTAIQEAARAKIGIRKPSKDKPWFDRECREWHNQRTAAKIDSLNRRNRAEQERYEEVCKSASRVMKNKKREWEKNRIIEIQNKLQRNETREGYRGINAFRKERSGAPELIRDEHGNLVADERGKADRWRRFFQGLLNVHTNQETGNVKEIHTAEPDMNEPTLEEVETAIRKLKNNKAPGIDEIPAELIKSGGKTLAIKIHKLICKIWDTERTPEEWKKSIIIPILKKGDKSDCNNYRGISLLPVCYKILSNILLARLTPYAEEIIGDYQCGFRRNRSTSDQMFTIRQILAKKLEVYELVHQLFVDFKKAYDSIIRAKMYYILVLLGIPKKLVRLIKTCTDGSVGMVRIDNVLSEPFEIHDGLKQGDALSPLLFNLVLEFVIRCVQLSKEGLTLNGTTQVLAYADDLDIVGDNRRIVIRNAEILIQAGKEIGLEVNEDKTKYMVADRVGQTDARGNLQVANMTFEKVNSFRYLGTIINNRNNMEQEIDKRLNAGNACYWSMTKLLRSRNLSRNSKIRIYKTIILPTVLYGCETWTLTRNDENRFRVFENRVLRRVYGPIRDEVSLEYRIRYNHELEELYQSPNIVRTIKARRLRWAGHVARMGDERTAYRVGLGAAEGRRRPGRPRLTWEKNIKDDIKEIGLDIGDWREYAQDREAWRGCVEEVMNFRVPNTN